MMVGVRPVADSLGRVNKLEVIPLEELKRPRVDVVVNCSGVFRDLFVNQVGVTFFREGLGCMYGYVCLCMQALRACESKHDLAVPCLCAAVEHNCAAAWALSCTASASILLRLAADRTCCCCVVLHCTLAPFHTTTHTLTPHQMLLLDRAIKMAAEQDEPDDMNFVRKHARQQAAEMGMSLRDAATRVFSNSSGSYSSNVNLAVENSSWSDEQQLQVRAGGQGCVLLPGGISQGLCVNMQEARGAAEAQWLESPTRRGCTCCVVTQSSKHVKCGISWAETLTSYMLGDCVTTPCAHTT